MAARPAKFAFRSALAGAVLIGLLAPAAEAAAQAANTARLRGTIARIDGTTMVVHPRSGDDVTVQLVDDVPISTVARATLADIKPNTFIGTAAVPQDDGKLRALEVVIFPEAMRGTGEGHRPWDLLPESTMTNATVADTVDAVDGHTMTLKYKGGQQSLLVPADAPIVTFVPGARSDLKPGETVFMTVQEQPDGSYRAARIVVSKNGVVPPM